MISLKKIEANKGVVMLSTLLTSMLLGCGVASANTAQITNTPQITQTQALTKNANQQATNQTQQVQQTNQAQQAAQNTPAQATQQADQQGANAGQAANNKAVNFEAMGQKLTDDASRAAGSGESLVGDNGGVSTLEQKLVTFINWIGSNIISILIQGLYLFTDVGFVVCLLKTIWALIKKDKWGYWLLSAFGLLAVRTVIVVLTHGTIDNILYGLLHWFGLT